MTWEFSSGLRLLSLEETRPLIPVYGLPPCGNFRHLTPWVGSDDSSPDPRVASRQSLGLFLLPPVVNNLRRQDEVQDASLDEGQDEDFVHGEEEGGGEAAEAVEDAEEGGGGGQLARALVPVVRVDLDHLQKYTGETIPGQ